MAVPRRITGEGDWTVDTLFSLDENQQIQMVIGFFDNTAPEGTPPEVLNVETINGQSVHDFIINLANNPAVSLPFQSVGGRVNNLISRNAVFTFMYAVGRPASILPDSFLVTYTDGTSETFVAGCFASTINSFYTLETLDDGTAVYNLDRAGAEELINSPGEQFEAYSNAVREINEVVGTPPGTRRKKRLLQDAEKQPHQPFPDITGISKASPPGLLKNRVLQEDPFPGSGENSLWNGGALTDDVYVFKIQSFSRSTPEQMLSTWEAIASSAAENGLTKLMIDLSGNPGGSVTTAYTTLFLLFPEVDIFWFLNQWDMNFNAPMQEYYEALFPIVGAVIDELPNLSDQVQPKSASCTEGTHPCLTAFSHSSTFIPRNLSTG